MLWAGIASLFQASLSPIHESQPAQHIQQEQCTHFAFSAFEPLRTGHVSLASLVPAHQLAAPKIDTQFNASVNEQWAFDATSADGTSGLLMGFYHDPTYAFLGPGNLRLSFDLVWPNGSTWSLVDYLHQADVHVCDQGTTGIWSKTNGDTQYSFFMAADNSVAILTLLTARVQGTVKIRSAVPARFANESLAESSKEQLFPTLDAPELHWAEPIPAGSAEVDLTLDGWPLRWDGMGGADRWWAARAWIDAMQGWRAVRAVAGPYVLTYWAPTSRLNRGVLYPSAFLAYRGRRVFLATQSGPSLPSDGGEVAFVEYRGIFSNGTLAGGGGGDVGSARHGVFRGYLITLAESSQGKRWEFTLTHKNKEFEFDLGGNSGGVAHVGTVSGGEVGGVTHHGVFFNEWVDISGFTVPSIYTIAASWYYRTKARIIGH